MSNNEDLKQKLRDNLAAMEADERGEPWEWFSSTLKWTAPRTHSLKQFIIGGYHCRPAPKPSVEYWSKPEHVPGFNEMLAALEDAELDYRVYEVGRWAFRSSKG